MANKKRVLPPALAKRAAILSKIKRNELAARGKTLIAVIATKRQIAASAFYEMGQALEQLADPAQYRACGYRTFEALVKTEFDVSTSYVGKLRLIADMLDERVAMSLGVEKSIAVASALKVPGVSLLGMKLEFRAPKFAKTFDTQTTAASIIERTTSELRQKHQVANGKRRGRTSSVDERSKATRMEKLLHKQGAIGATVKCIATQPGQPSDLVIRINMKALVALRSILPELAR